MINALKARMSARPGSPPLLVAGLLAALAGAVDAIGYITLGQLFVAFMSGNSTVLAVSVVNAKWAEAGRAAWIVAAFVLGVSFGTVLGPATRRFHMPAVMGCVTALLTVAAAWPHMGMIPVTAMVFAMGTINAATDTAGGVPVSLTFVTGTLVRFGRGLGRAVLGERSDLKWLAQAAIWGSLVVGAALGASGHALLGRDALWGTALAAGVLTALTAAIPRLRGTAAG